MTLSLLAFGVVACAAARNREPQAANPEVERAAAERHLRRLFPGLEGEISREAIAAELERDRGLRDASSPVRSAAVQAIERGDFDRARDLLGELLAGTEVLKARDLADRGDSSGALAALDRALETAPKRPGVLCARAEAALAVDDPDRRQALRESALANFLEAARIVGESQGEPEASTHQARAWLGASRAARALSRREDALEYARRGLAALGSPFDPEDDGGYHGGGHGDALRRAFAEASLDAYFGAKREGASPEILRARASDSHDALAVLLGSTPEDPWSWASLAQLSGAEGSPEASREVALRGLSIAPDDEALLERLSLAARDLGGPRAAIAAFEPFCRRHPDVAAAAWHLAAARFDLAVDQSRVGSDPVPGLAAAEAGFARCRALDGAFEERSRAQEARCRGARGGWLLALGDLDGARDAFLSMEDAAKGSLTLEIAAGSDRGIDGLHRVALAYSERGDEGFQESIDNLEQAARIFDLLHEVEPGDARFAAGAGRTNREAAVALELEARALSKDRPAEAERLLARAREVMDRAFRALDAAAGLAPRDGRIAAEAGAVLVRYLHREPERARAFLETAVEIGEASILDLAARADEPGLPEAEREARRLLLEEEETLVGDACHDLGTLHLTLLGDPRAAVEWLEKGRRIGPDPRVEIDGLLERCRKALAGGLDPKLRDENRWAAPLGAGRTP